MTALHVPRNTPYIQEHVDLHREHAVEYKAGEVRWRLRHDASNGTIGTNGKRENGSSINGRSEGEENGEKGGDEDAQDWSGSFREDEIVFICREAATEPPESEQRDLESEPRTSTASSYAVYLVRETPGNPDEPFRLWAVSAPAGVLPPDLVERHLLTKPPAHLLGAGGAALGDGLDHQLRPGLHVVVSTKSGMGLAQAVYGAVLQKLLAVLGLRPRPAADDDLTPPESPGSESSACNGNGNGGDGHFYNLFVTKSRCSIRDLAHANWGKTDSDAGRNGQNGHDNPGPGSAGQLIILLSGDGGVVDLLNGAGADDDENAGSSLAPLPTIALLPLGTGNALFHSLHRPLYQRQGTASAAAAAVAAGGPSHLVLGLRTLFRGVAAPLPTFRASFSPGSTLVPHVGGDLPPSPPLQQENEGGEISPAPVTDAEDAKGEPVDSLLGAIVASYGFHAQLVWESDTPAYRRHGDKRFGMAARELLAIDHAYDAVVEVQNPTTDGAAAAPPGDLAALPNGNSHGVEQDDGRKWTRLASGDDEEDGAKLAYVLATMVSNLERTFTISPASRPLDGALRLVSFGAVGAEKTMEIMQRAYDDGAHVRMAEEEKKVVGYDEVDAVRVVVRERDARWRKVCVDGTIVEVPRDGWMVVRRVAVGGRFRVLVDGSVL